MDKNILNWLNNNFKCDLNNKTIVITGANSGIGFEVAKICVQYNANVIMCIRNLNKGEKAKEKILEEYPNAKITLLKLDVSNIESINNFTEYVINNKIDVDVFYNNAGILTGNGKSVDNIELVMATNYIGTYILNERLYDYFKSLNHEVRIIFTTSIAQYIYKLNYDDFFSEKRYKSFKAYAKSKRAVTHYFIHYKNKCENSNVKALLVHPGITHTPLIEKSFNKTIASLANKFMNIIFHKTNKAALSTIYLLNDDIKNGIYCGPRGLFGISGYPTVKKVNKKILKNFNRTITFTNNYIYKK